MYKLILVDDESDVREGILQEIEWEKYGFEVAGTADNGRDAYELVEKTVPDLVITDIKMPFMDGLQLSELIRQSYPAAKIIILTGFDEFAFAQKAIKLQIYEYVLKPFSSQELINAIVKVKSQIDEETAQKKNIETLREHYEKTLPVLKGNFLTLLVTKKLNENEIWEKSETYGLELAGSTFAASVISMDNPIQRELCLFAVLNITEEIVEKHRLGTVFIHGNNLVVLSTCVSKEPETVVISTIDAMEEIRYSVEKYLDFTLTIGIGSVVRDISDICYSYNDAVLALDYRPILGVNRLIFIEDLEKRYTKNAVFDELKEQALISSIKVGTQEEVSETIGTLFSGLSDANVSYKDYQIYLMEILTAILKIVKDANINPDGVFGPDFNLFAEISRFNSIQEIKAWTSGICTRIMKNIATQRQTSCRQLVKSAREYTQARYHESDLNIKKVCRHLHISPGYFSSIFKKEMKMTYLTYLVQLRMEMAKELLRTTELRTFEIAEKVGFSEANYFSNCFKKNFGISPSEYRNKV